MRPMTLSYKNSPGFFPNEQTPLASFIVTSNVTKNLFITIKSPQERF